MVIVVFGKKIAFCNNFYNNINSYNNNINVENSFCCLIFLWEPWFLFFRKLLWIESLKWQDVFQMQIFCDSIDAFNVNFWSM